MEVKQILSLFLDFNMKYPELLEFPNGIQNVMTIFYQDIVYDITLLRKVCEVIGCTFNIIMAKDQFIQKMHDENEEPYVEYLQPTFLIIMSALKMGLDPAITKENR